ncbi:MAG TPA: transglutaminase-like domain-containing protein [Candidatus Polarisedimenticolia bacterium]|nr:transglutaminase-like domain-containing protein [Candidatus Polarisedimenticolia bacterium]
MRRRAFYVAAGLLLAGLLLWVAQSEIVVVTDEENGEIPSSSYVLEEEDFRHPRLQLLRSRERLDEVVAGTPRQFEAALRLRAWAHRQWEPGVDFYYPPWDAVEILDLTRQHGNRGFCAQYAIVFLQACQSMGIHARYVDLPGHFVVAIWSDDFDRWVVMDPMNDLHYEKEGVPMRGRDLYRAYWTKDATGIEQVDSKGRRRVTLEDLGHYRLYSIDTAADQLTEPVAVRINGAWKTLTHTDDYRLYPRVGRDQLQVESEFLAWRSGEANERFPERPETSEDDDFRYAMNQTIILLANSRVRKQILKLALLRQNSPTFARFQVRSEASTDWVPSPADTVKWMLHPGENEIQARIETRDGWKGPASTLKLYYKPRLFTFLPAFPGYIYRVVAHSAS